MKTAIIILQYNNHIDTINCIRSIDEFNSSKICYIIVDNHSTNLQSVSAVESFLTSEHEDSYQILSSDICIRNPLPKFTLYKHKENKGYSAGNNIALNIALLDETVNTVLILNNDILFIEDIIPKLNQFLLNEKTCGIVSPILVKRDKITLDRSCARKDITPYQIIFGNMLSFSKSLYSKVQESQYLISIGESDLPKIMEVTLPSGSCMMMSTAFLKKIGNLDENTFLYYEENILSKKAHQLGLKIYLLSDLRCIHLGGESTKKVDSKNLMLISKRSCLYYLKNYCSYSGLNIFFVKLSWNLRISVYALFKFLYKKFKVGKL